MKSRVLFLLAVLLIVMALASCSVASSNKEPNDNDINSGKPEAIDSQASKGIEYTLLDDGTYEVSGIGYCIDTHIVISRTYQGKPVTSIGERAFDYCTSLTSITIPDSVTSIGDYAFDGCKSLESITVEEGNTVYHSSGNCLIETTSKTLVLGCKTSAIPTDGSVTSIGVGAFSNCASLTSITIPDSVTSIGEGAFYGCNSLESITVEEGNTVYHSSGNCLIETTSKTLVLGCKTSVIPTDGSVTSIGEGAFNFCTSLESITIPDGVTSIGDSAFDGCSSLKSITIPESVTSIGYKAFSFCTSLTSITIPESVTSIRYDAFYRCSSLTSITIPDGVTRIGFHAFEGCTSLTSITIPDSVTEIGEKAFRDCTSLTRITLGNGITSIGEKIFKDCSSLTSITYNGTKDEWKAIEKGPSWDNNTGDYTIHCTDGDISK